MTSEIKFPIAYVSKKLLPRETRYLVIERECLALVWGIQKFHMYLYGNAFKSSPFYMQTTKLTNGKVMRLVFKKVFKSIDSELQPSTDLKTIGHSFLKGK